MTGNLYQLKTNAPVGALVTINGPYDTYGRVIARKPSGYHLIRGEGHGRPTEVAYPCEEGADQ